MDVRNPGAAAWRQLAALGAAVACCGGSAVAAPVAGSVASEAALHAYLDATPPARISAVAVGTDEIKISGRLPAGAGECWLAEVPIDYLLDDPRRCEVLVALSADQAGAFHLAVPRVRSRHGRRYDRLTSRWEVVAKDGVRLSHARYADEVACRAPSLPAAKPKTKKGLGGWRADRAAAELDELGELGIAAITVNIVLDSLACLTEEPGATAIVWQGQTYYMRQRALEELDATFLQAQQKGIMVSAILLVANRPGRLAHPAAERPGRYAMPGVTSMDGVDFYGAILNAMAERWTRPDGAYGRVHHWIMHNEVDAGAEWTNAGNLPAIVYLDLYQRSLRLMDLIVRQYDPSARAFVSLTHHWAEAGNPRWYGSRQVLELLAKFCRVEGDFFWGVAFHPYPQNLANPRTWLDDEATLSFASRKITPRNLEVLDAYMHLAAMRYRGKLRPVHLAENGFNSPDYSPDELNAQAAGMALAWKKLQTLESIHVWHYHNWADNRNEFGLRIGLRRYPDDPAEPLGRKPIWFLYQALGSPGEDAACAPFLPVVGIRSWADAIHLEPIK